MIKKTGQVVVAARQWVFSLLITDAKYTSNICLCRHMSIIPLHFKMTLHEQIKQLITTSSNRNILVSL